MLLQHRYEIILFPNYLITVVYYYCTHPILFLYFFSIPNFLPFLNFCINGFFFVFIWNLQFHISFNVILVLTMYFTLYTLYNLDSTIAGSKNTLIICSFLVQRINLKHHTVLNCIHAYHVSNNLNGVKS